MKTNTMWTAATRLLRKQTADRARGKCSVSADHQGPLVAVAGRGSDTTMMCLRHAVAWAESDLCQDVAAHNSKTSLRALSLWAAAESAAS
jgi:hypothetical protein